MEQEQNKKSSPLSLFGIAGMLALFCFGGFFIYFTIQEVSVTGTRDSSGKIDMDIVRSHFWGLYQTAYHLEDVKAAEIQKKEGKRSSRGTKFSVSTPYIRAENNDAPIFVSFTSFDEEFFKQACQKVNTFVQNQDEKQFSKQINYFSYFSFFGFFIWALLVLKIVFTVIKTLRHTVKQEDIDQGEYRDAG